MLGCISVHLCSSGSATPEDLPLHIASDVGVMNLAELLMEAA